MPSKELLEKWAAFENMSNNGWVSTGLWRVQEAAKVMMREVIVELAMETGDILAVRRSIDNLPVSELRRGN